MENWAVELRDVDKYFKIYADKGSTLKEKILFGNRSRHEDRAVLKGLSLQVPRGQAVGFIGRNGCGKSTVLKLLARILKPNAGSVCVCGRVSSLIELGAGFHPDMSGRENIYINATIFGLTREEIDGRLGEIIRFSELAEFIDNPVRTYSSGMYMRLAFAVAINVNADVLLVDEILAVGDVSFQKKCFERLKEIKEEGTTIAIVSHSMEQLYNICDRLIWLEGGAVREDGMPRTVGMHYLDSMEDERIERLARESSEKLQGGVERSILELTPNVHPEARRSGTWEVYFTKVELLGGDGRHCQIFDTGDEVTLVCHYATELKRPAANFNMDFVRDNWQYCYGACLCKSDQPLPELEHTGRVTLKIAGLKLLPGKYYLDVGINGPGGELYDNVRNVLQITVRDYVTDEFGPCVFEHRWNIDQDKTEKG